MAARKERIPVARLISQRTKSDVYIYRIAYIKTIDWLFPAFEGLLSRSMNVRLL